MRFPINTYKGEEPLEEIIPTKRNRQFNLVFSSFFFKWRFHFQHILRLFQDSFIFREATSSHFFNYIDTTVTLSEHLFLQSSCFFLRSSVFERVISSQHLFFQNINFQEQNFYRAATLCEQEVLQGRYFSQQSLFWWSNCLE